MLIVYIYITKIQLLCVCLSLFVFVCLFVCLFVWIVLRRVAPNTSEQRSRSGLCEGAIRREATVTEGLVTNKIG